MIVSIAKKSAAAPQRLRDEVYPAEFEGEAGPLKYRRVHEKPTGAYVTVPQATGSIFFFLVGGFMFGHTVPATSWGGELGLSGIILGVFIGVAGREKIKGVFRKCLSAIQNSRFRISKSRSVSVSTGTNGLARSHLEL